MSVETTTTARDLLLDLAGRAFFEGDHPRAPEGSTTGGQFVAGGGGGGGKKTPAKKAAAAQKRKPAPQRRPADGGVLAYDPASGRGTGYGMKGGDPRVRKLQDALIRLGLTDGSGKKLTLDGKLGPKTTAAVKKAQKRLGLKPDGRVTPALLDKLASAKSLPGRSAGMLDVCVRSFDFESRGVKSRNGRRLEGYAAVYGRPARIRDMKGDFEETIRYGAFARSLSERTPVMQWEHGKDPRVGAVPIAEIVDLDDRADGLFVAAELYDNPVVEPIRQAIAGNSVKGMSFRFEVAENGDDWTRDGRTEKREILDADVHELGPVVFPAYDATSVSVRSLLAQLDPDEYRALVHELAAAVRLAVDLDDFTGRPDARSAGGGDPDEEPERAAASAPTSNRQRLDDGALRVRGILR